jgi:Glucose / Sorbosone dehydrogenase
MSESISATLVASGLGDVPVFLAALPGAPGRAVVALKGGRVEVLDLATGAVEGTPLLDLTGRVATAGEMGLLGLAFDPGFGAGGRLYLSLSNPAGDTEIRAYTVGPDGRADPAGGDTILTVAAPDGLLPVHRAGWLGFGPDGLLHMTTGDGGDAAAAHDPAGLLGKVLRLDPSGDDFPADPGRDYAVPAGNPFAAGGGAGEVLAYGFRNPWRASFDPATGRLFLADVGNDRWEEVDIVAGAGPYGWPFFEGPAPFFADGAVPPDGFAFPVHAYSHESGDGSSVTGGYVWRGPGGAGPQGDYVFGDFGSGNLWALSEAAGGGWERRLLLAGPAPGEAGAGRLGNPTSFGLDHEGRLYALAADGEVFRLDPAEPQTTPEEPPPEEPSPEPPSGTPQPPVVDWDAVAEQVQAAFESTGQWFRPGEGPPTDPGPSPDPDWDAVAAQVLANLETVGQWFL